MRASRPAQSIGLLLAMFLALGAGMAQAGIVAPTDISGTVLWLDAGDASTITLAGGEVAQWNDKSGAGNHFAHGAAGERPVVTPGTLNGRAVLTFDGANDRLSKTGGVLAAGDDDYTYYAVWRPHTNSGLHRVYEQYALNAANRYGAMLAVNDRYGFNGQNNDRHDLIPYGANQWRLTDLRVNNDNRVNIFAYDNGTHFAGRTGDPATLDLGADAGTIGAKNQGAAGEWLDGDLAELIVYNRKLTPAERKDVGDYLSAKYNLGVAYAAVPGQGLVHRWAFNDGTMNDSVGTAHGTGVFGNAQVAGGKLVLDGAGDYVTTAPVNSTIGEKTLVAWVAMDDLSAARNGAGVLGMEAAPGIDAFESIVYGERVAGQWMNGSSFWHRSVVNNGGAAETSNKEVMLAIVYGPGNTINLYRNGVPYNTLSATQGALQEYPAAIARAVFGRRNAVSGPEIDGSINEARIYNFALTGAEIQAVWQAGIEPTGMIHQWTFNDGTAKDSVGTAHGTLFNGATVSNLQLRLDGMNDYVRTAPVDNTIAEKTLVAWVRPENLAQQSGGVLTLENPGSTAFDDVFDSITYGERTAGQWMSGSNGWARSDGVNNGGPLETSTGLVMMAIAYGPGGAIDIYRDGVLYASYTTGGPIGYTGGVADVILGLRHLDALGQTGATSTGNDAYWAGWIDEARIYNHALTLSEVRFLFNQGVVVPEPGSWLLLATGAVGLAGVARLRRRRR